jgi:arginine decarboxylase
MSKFGLHATQVLQLVERLRSENPLDRLQLLHFHLGSQLPKMHSCMRWGGLLRAILRRRAALLRC